MYITTEKGPLSKPMFCSDYCYDVAMCVCIWLLLLLFWVPVSTIRQVCHGTEAALLVRHGQHPVRVAAL